jgi:deoxycytidine triphosphate deaminase
VLSKMQMKVLCDEGFVVKVEQPEKAIGPSSIDLHVSDEAYETTGGSVKPFGDQYRYQIEKQGLIKHFERIDDGYQLTRGNTYLICVRERFEKVAQLAAANIFGVSTPKSSVGRMDVLVRLVVDFMDAYDGFVPDRLSKSSGEMFLEVTPISFDVRVRPGDSLCQLRFVYGRPEHCELRGPEIALTTLGVRKEDGSLSADLEPTVVGRSKTTKASAFRAREDAEQGAPFDLWKKPDDQRPDPTKFWSPEISDPSTKRLTIAKGSFYILRSKERIRVPRSYYRKLWI